jgi:hypothetical protein
MFQLIPRKIAVPDDAEHAEGRVLADVPRREDVDELLKRHA